MPIILLYCLLYFALVAFGLYPGSPGLDAREDLEFLSRNIIYGQRPPLYQLIAKTLSWINPDRLEAGLFVFQVAVYTLAIAVIAHHCCKSMRSKLLFLLLATLPPPLLANISYIGTDTTMVVMMMLLTIVFITRKKTITPQFFLLTLFLSLLVTLSRYNAIIATMPFINYSLYKILPNKRSIGIRSLLSIGGTIIICGILSLVSIGFSSSLINKKNAVTGVSFSSQYLIFHDLVGMSVKANQNLLPKKYSERTIPELREIYAPNAGSVFWNIFYIPIQLHPYKLTVDDKDSRYCTGKKLQPIIDPKEFSILKAIWLNAVLNHPVAYLKHRWFMTESLLGLADHRKCMPYEDILSYELSVNQNPGISPNSIRLPLNRKLFMFFYSTKDSFWFSGWFYLAIHCIILVFSMSSRKMPVSYKLINLSALAYFLLYFFIVPGCFFRYILWPVFAAYLLIGLILAYYLRQQNWRLPKALSVRGGACACRK